MVKVLKRQISKLYRVYVTNIKALVRCPVTAPYMQYTGFLSSSTINVFCDLLMYSRHEKGVTCRELGTCKDGDQTEAKFCCSCNGTVR